MSKNLLLIELNECDFKFFLYGSKKYNYPLIKKFFSKKKLILLQKIRKKVLTLIHGFSGYRYIQVNYLKIIKFSD